MWQVLLGHTTASTPGGSRVSIKASFYKVLAEFDSQYSGENPRHWAGVVVKSTSCPSWVLVLVPTLAGVQLPVISVPWGLSLRLCRPLHIFNTYTPTQAHTHTCKYIVNKSFKKIPAVVAQACNPSTCNWRQRWGASLDTACQPA